MEITGLISTNASHFYQKAAKSYKRRSFNAALDGAMRFASIVPMHNVAIKRLLPTTATC